MTAGSGGMDRVVDCARRIGDLDSAAMDAALRRQAELTKPAGSLGRLEEVAVRIAGITGLRRASLRQRAIIVMAADHGVAEEGVSAYPQEVTAQMVLNFLGGGAAINVLARAVGARVVVVDMGVAAELANHPDLVVAKIARGTRDFARGPAMRREQAIEAIEAGIRVLDEQARQGLDVVGTGEMGIGNTTAASAIASVFTGKAPGEITGRGTGIDDATLAAKVAVIERAIELNHPDPADPIDVLHKVGGFEIAGLVGVILAAAARRIPVIVDGFISTAAALVAAGICPAVTAHLIAAHRSAEIGHRPMLDHLGLDPLLDLGLRLGEGTGAALAMHLVDAALRIPDEMATFGEAGVSRTG